MAADPATQLLLESDDFRRCRVVAESIAGHAPMLRALLLEVEDMLLRTPTLRALPSSVTIDIAAAVIDAHAEDLENGGSWELLEACRADRLRLVCAGLHYAVLGADGSHRHRFLDDLSVVRWSLLSSFGAESA